MTWFKQDQCHCSVRKSVAGTKVPGRGCSSKPGRDCKPGLDWCVVEMWQGLHFWVCCEIRVKGLANTWDVGCERERSQGGLEGF